MEISNVSGLTNDEERIFAKAFAIVKAYELGNVIDHHLDNVNAVSEAWGIANKYEREIALDIVTAQRNETLNVPLSYSIMAHAYDAVTYREVLTENLSKKTRDMACAQVETHEHEIAFELLTFMKENEIEIGL